MPWAQNPALSSWGSQNGRSYRSRTLLPTIPTMLSGVVVGCSGGVALHANVIAPRSREPHNCTPEFQTGSPGMLTPCDDIWFLSVLSHVLSTWYRFTSRWDLNRYHLRNDGHVLRRATKQFDATPFILADILHLQHPFELHVCI